MNQQQMEELLQEASYGRLGLARGQQPYVVPLCFYYENNRIYWHCGLKGQKVDYLEHNPRVCFQVDDVKGIIRGPSACKYNINYRSVIAYGTVQKIVDQEEKQRYLGKLAGKYMKDAEPAAVVFSEKQLAGVNLIKLEIESLTGKTYPKSLTK